MTGLYMNIKIFEGRKKNCKGKAPLLDMQNAELRELKNIVKKYFG